MSDHHHEQDDLFARMRDADPAASLPAADPDRVARLLEDAMSPETPTRNPLAWLAAAAAVVLIAAGGVFALQVAGGDDPAPPSAGAPADPTGSEEPTTTELTLPTGAPARCMVPSAGVLGNAAFAVDAEVTSVADGTAVLTPTQWFAGDPTDQLAVADVPEDLQALLLAPELEEGQRYLVAGNDRGQIMVCGFSGPWSQERADLYSEAFDS